MVEYCIGREGLDDYVLYRGDPIFEEAYRHGQWHSENLAGVYSGDTTIWLITDEAAKLVEQGKLTPKEAHLGDTYKKL